MAAKKTAAAPTAARKTRAEKQLDRQSQQKKQVLDLLRQGHFVRHACEATGIDHSTWYYWQKNDPDLVELQRRAEMEAALVQLRKITSDASWQSAAWYLERKFPEWRKPELQTVVHQGEQTIVLSWPEDKKEGGQ